MLKENADINIIYGEIGEVVGELRKRMQNVTPT